MFRIRYIINSIQNNTHMTKNLFLSFCSYRVTNINQVIHIYGMNIKSEYRIINTYILYLYSTNNIYLDTFDIDNIHIYKYIYVSWY